MAEFASDLDFVKRSLGERNAQPLAKTAPPSAQTPKREALSAGRYQKEGQKTEEAPPLKLAKNFDSFDATLKLAAMTNQTAEFEKYITDTKKLRAFKHLAPGASATGPQPRPGPADTQGQRNVRFAHLDQLEQYDRARRTQGMAAAQAPSPKAQSLSAMAPIALIVLLAVLAVGLSVALILR
ncbi:MAG: hypothetical protein JNJ55_09960 [Betaproteobacteria bacterium]|nr:hypothetical protein [Betaproteobacteria bacterium]